MENVTPSPAPVWKCDYCSKTFGRTEHLKRHLLIHTKENVFRCGYCSKEFIRRDALQRHNLIHQGSGLSLLHTGGRACFNCRSTKARCSGGEKCERCHRRCLSCQYPSNGLAQNKQVPNGSPGIAATPDGSGSISKPPMNLPQSTFYVNPEVIGDGIVTPSVFNPNFESDSNFWNSASFSTINWLDSDIQNFESFQPVLTPQSYHQSFDPVSTLYEDRCGVESPHGVVSTPGGFSNGSAISIVSPQSTQSHNNFNRLEGPPSAPGEYYVDGEAARLPRVKRRKLKSQSTPHEPSREHSEFSLNLPALAPAQDHVLANSSIDENAYSQILKAYDQLCLHGTETCTTFEVVEFPTLNSLTYLMDLYFANFNTIIPIFHTPTYKKESLYWLVCLAMLAIGSLYLENELSETFSHSMNEFLRRAVVNTEQKNAMALDTGFYCVQIGILQAISNSYSENGNGGRLRAQLLWTISDSGSAFETDISSSPPRQDSSNEEIEQVWKCWRQTESSRRAWYSVWLLDCMWAFQFDDRPTLILEDAKRPLPCHECLWNAETSTEWYELQSKYPPTPTLVDALQKMYIDKHVSPELGEFSRQLLIHGLFRRSWEVENYLRQRLSHWEPTAQKQASEEALPKSPIWLPSVPTFNKWRNSACDCIDILHWDANAKIGAASGLEHPTVLHLHLSRVILLTPFREITRLAQSLADGNLIDSSEQIRQSRDIVRRWATQDQFKARLAMIHAGVLFWHVRRHSANAFYEPSSIYIATLALWAFSAFSSSPPSSHVQAGNSRNDTQISRDGLDNDDTELPTSEIILLDRPTDDELVQEFVRNGSRMWPQMSRIGNLYGKNAACRVLAVGKELLDTLTCWKIARRQSRMLDVLKDVWKPQMANG